MRKQKLTSALLILIGIFLEIYFYYYRFNSDSGMVFIPLVQGAGLTLLLIGLFRLRRSWLAWAFITPLFLFSIFSTSSGQRQQLVAETKATVQGINNQLIADLEESLSRKLEAYEADAGIVKFESIEERARWRTTVSGVKDDISAKEEEIDAIEAQIAELRNPKIEQSEVGELYQFYSNLIGVDADVIQTWLQFAFSFFIAVMAPVGLLLWPTVTEEKTDWDFFVREWVHTNWTGIRNGQTRSILSKEKFIEFKRSRGVRFTESQYDQIKKAAIKSEVVDSDGITMDNEEEAIKAIKNILER